MATPTTSDDFLQLVRQSGLLEEERLNAYLQQMWPAPPLPEPMRLGCALVRDGLLTYFQAKQLLRGKWRGFRIGGYRVLERVGSGGGSNVFLCDHLVMRHRVAIKVLAQAPGDESAALQRFYREARAGATLRHPNIVRAYDVGCDGRLHFLVMDYVDGSNLRYIVRRHGPLYLLRAAHYVRQAALGLQHAHERGVVHRDVNPGNLLLDRRGTVKLLDLGLARFLHEPEPDQGDIVGTADYMAPEQARDSASVDWRADIYGLGATFYYLMTGQPPFAEAQTLARKLICHQAATPASVRELRPDVPEALAAIVDRMLAKDPAQRYQSAAEVAAVLAFWTQVPISVPPAEEMPRLSRAAWGGRTLIRPPSQPTVVIRAPETIVPGEALSHPLDLPLETLEYTPAPLSSQVDTVVCGPTMVLKPTPTEESTAPAAEPGPATPARDETTAATPP
jgi:serine/threonine protein kinase